MEENNDRTQKINEINFAAPLCSQIAQAAIRPYLLGAK